VPLLVHWVCPASSPVLVPATALHWRLEVVAVGDPEYVAHRTQDAFAAGTEPVLSPPAMEGSSTNRARGGMVEDLY